MRRVPPVCKRGRSISSSGETRARKPRADAERNRRLLLDTAKSVFAARGAAVSLDEIARAAGVGIGTLYRHFPTRDALVTEVYRSDTAQLVDAATTLAQEQSPVEALRGWMRLFVDYLATKQAVAGAFMGGGDVADLYCGSGTTLIASFETLADAAVKSGAIRLEVAPTDLLRALAGVVQAGAGAENRAAALRFVDLLIAGVAVRG